MRPGFVSKFGNWTRAVLAIAAALALFPHRVSAWGRGAHKLVVNQAIDTLPQDLRPFFESYRAVLIQHVNDPLDVRQVPV